MERAQPAELRSAASNRGRQSGASIVETVIALPILLVVILGAIQFGLVYEAKATLNHASLQAARLGAVRNAQPDAIRRGLARGLAPLHSPDASLTGVARTVERLNNTLRGDARIRILNPTREAFDDFGVDVDDEREIPNDRLHVRSTTVGSQSGINIQDANLLKVEITYGYELQVPLVNWFIARVLLRVSRDTDSFEQQLLRRTRIPIIATATVRMQSPARLSDANVSAGDFPDVTRIPSDAAPPPVSEEEDETEEESPQNGDTSPHADDEDDSDETSLEDGFLGFGGGAPSAEGGGVDGGSAGGGLGGGANGGSPLACTVEGGGSSPFPFTDPPPGDFSPTPNPPGLPGLPGWVNSSAIDSEASLGVVSFASLSVGNPIHVVTGNKYQAETDIDSMPGALALAFKRHYNSAAVNDRNVLGAGWRHSYQASLRQHSDGTIQIVQADGRLLTFRRSARSNDSHTDAEEMSRSTPTASSGAIFLAQRASDGEIMFNRNQFIWRWPSGRELHFDADGRLTRIRDGIHELALRYDDSGELLVVTDPQERELRFTYYPNGRLASVRGPARIAFHYTYDGKGNLSQAVGADGKARRYTYEDERHPHHLSGILAGSIAPLAYGERRPFERIATWAYDEKGRAVFSSHPDDAGKVTLRFAADHTEVTDAFGRKTNYIFGWRDGVAYVREVRGPGCGTCGSGDAKYDYDDRFKPTLVASKSSPAIKYQYDDLGRVVQVDRIRNGQWDWMARYRYAGSLSRVERIERPSVQPGKVAGLEMYYTASGLIERTRETGFSPLVKGFAAIDRETLFSYDDHARLRRIDGPRTDVNDWMDFEYDDFGRVIVLTTPAGEQRIAGYDSAGRPTRLTRSGHPDIELRYDMRGRITSVAHMRKTGVLKTSYRFDAVGRLTRIIDPLGRSTRYNFDAAGRVNRMSRSDATTTAIAQYGPDDSIERIAAFGTNGQILRTLFYVYDSQRRLTEVRDGTGQPLQQLEYLDDDAFVDRKIDPLGNSTLFGYDDVGQLTSIVAPDGGSTVIERDAIGRTESVKAPNDAKTRYRYDDFGRRVFEESPDRGITQHFYDAAGNLIRKTDARGSSAAFSFDAANRLIQVKRAEGTTKLSYGNGLLTNVDGEVVDERYEYDLDGQLTKHTRALDGHTYITRFSFDSSGRMQTRDLPSGARLRYRYGETGELASITRERWFADQLLVRAGADDAASVKLTALGSYTFGNGIQVRTVFDASTGNISRRAIETVGSLDYEHDEAGRISTLRKDGDERRYAYDAVGRLVATNTPEREYTFVYDTNANRMSSSRADEYTTYAYEPKSNRLSSIDSKTKRTYDAAGNPIEIGARRYEYDTNGRPTKMFEGERLVAEYRYNFWGERVQKVVYEKSKRHVTSFIYEQRKLIAEADERGNITREYIYLDHHPIALLQNAQVNWIHTDHLGTPIAVTNSIRKQIWQADHHPFGEAISNSDPDRDEQPFELNLRFPGQYADAESGTHYNYFRDYDPKTGRYLTSDPIGAMGGMNSFAYASGNPLSGMDSLGLYDEMVHYYITYFLGIVAGLPQDVARTMAIAAQYIDENPLTKPTAGPLGLLGSNDRAIPLYHFVLDYDGRFYGDQSEDASSRFYDPSSTQLDNLFRSTDAQRLNELWARHGNTSQTQCDASDRPQQARYQLFGEFLHSFEDTFAHRDMFNMPYAPASNAANQPVASEGHFGLHGLIDYEHPDRTFNQDLEDTPSECWVGSTVSTRRVHRGWTESQCRQANGTYTWSTDNVWGYNELRTLRMEHEVFGLMQTNFQEEIAANRRAYASAGRQLPTIGWQQLAGGAWNPRSEQSNARLGVEQSYDEWRELEGFAEVETVLQRYNASDEDEADKLLILTEWLYRAGFRDQHGNRLEIELHSAMLSEGASRRWNNIGWLPAASFQGILLPRDERCTENVFISSDCDDRPRR